MATTTQPPLDELQHHRPDIIAWWVTDYGGLPMDENMIHRYLAESAFFDHSTKNGLHFLQAEKLEQEFFLVMNRRRFEEVLRGQVGVEFLIVGEPVDVPASLGGGGGGGGGKEKSGIWVLRKQDRQRARGGGGFEDDLTTLGTYYVVNERMYQAPSVGEILGNRIVAATTQLNKFLSTASTLPSFDPTAGYTYLPHLHNTQQAARSQGQTTTTSSSHASPAPLLTRSREPSVLPTADPTALTTQRSASLLSTTNTNPANNHANTAESSRLLATSLQHALEFRDEFTDENPLLGEPGGTLSFSASLASVAKKRKAAEEMAAALQAAAKAKESASAGRGVGGVKAEGVGEPPAVMSASRATAASAAGSGGGQGEGGAQVGLRERRGSKLGERVRRKKSRANAGSMVGVVVAEGGGT